MHSGVQATDWNEDWRFTIYLHLWIELAVGQSGLLIT
jgi:hypothetical protein